MRRSAFLLVLTILQGIVFFDPVHNHHIIVFLCIVAGRLPGIDLILSCVYCFVLTHYNQFLYIDLFIIIPVAVASECLVEGVDTSTEAHVQWVARFHTNVFTFADRLPAWSQSLCSLASLVK